MSTTTAREKQWLQIFERQRWIINQAKQQAFLFEQDLASKLLIDGITPPPWLFSSEPKVLNQHELVSGIPLSRRQPGVPFTASRCSVIEKPVTTAQFGVGNGLCVEVRGVNEGFDVGDKVLVSPQCRVSDARCKSNGVGEDHREEDASVTSPEDERDARASDVYCDDAVPQCGIINAGEEVSDMPQCDISNAGYACNSVPQILGEEDPRVNSQDCERDARVSDSQDCERDARVSDVYCEPTLSPTTGAGEEVSTSTQSPITNAGFTSNGVPQDQKEGNASVTSPDNQRDLRMSDIHHVPALSPATDARQVSVFQQSSTGNAGCASNCVSLDNKEEIHSTPLEDQREASMLDIYHDPDLSLARVQRSKSRQRALEIRNSANKSCSQDQVNANGYDGVTIKCVLSAPQSENVGDLNDNHSALEKPKIGEFHSKERGTGTYTGRITRSRSSGHQNSSLNISGLPCIGMTSGGIAADTIGKSTQLSNHINQPVEPPNDVNCVHKSSSGSVNDDAGRSTVKHSCSKSAQPPQPLSWNGGDPEFHDPHGLQLSIRATISPGSFVLVQEDLDLCAGNSTDSSASKHGADQYAGRSTSTETNCTTEGMSNPVNCQDFVDTEYNVDDSGLRVGVEVLVSRQSTDADVYVKPKQLDFYNVEKSCFNEMSTLASKKETQGRSSVKMPLSLMYAEDVLDEGRKQENCNSSLGNCKVSGKETKVQTDIVEAVAEDLCKSRRSDGNMVSPEYVQRSIGDDRDVSCSKSTECQATVNSKGRSFYALVESSPKHKRRKTEDKRIHDLLDSVRLREEVVHIVKQDSMHAEFEREEHSPITVQESQGISISEEDAVNSTVSRNLVEERHVNEDPNMVLRSEFSHEAQKKEAGIELEEMDSSANALFTFFHEESEALLFSSLIKQAGRNPQDYSMDETRVTHETSINIDDRSQCIPLHLPDYLRLGNAEELSCAKRTMQGRRFDFGGTSQFSELSDTVPHVNSSELIGADETMPDFETFVIKTDDEPHKFTGEGLSFNEWNLSNTTLERAGILEQLCKSACMQTPVVCSSASYELHKVPNLCQSVPVGLLDHVDRSPTLPQNDSINELKDSVSFFSEEVGHAFCGTSYSGCLPNASGQPGWDIKKPYTSPVGKVWDRIALSSSSSGKRVSSIPELPCISEENENPDEIADTFQEGFVSELFDSSVKRPPLADNTDNPNPPASVFKAVPYADRYSLDSVNTEYSLTGNQKSVKRKLGIQNSSKRRYTNKENHSVSRGTRDIKRATGSHLNRSSKPKIPGKPSFRKGGTSLSELEPKQSNIVTNITSFVPLVQQKLAAAALPVKRDIKVKALETAEAAKRLAERKENERKMKKEAMKVERARVEQENLRQLELQRKKKEDDRKKNEADMAAKKRQREEEDRKEKQRKRMRVEEVRREHREHEDKLRAEKMKKDIKRQAIDGRECESKESKGNMGRKKMDEESWCNTLRSISETDPRISHVSTSNDIRGSIVHEECSDGLSNFEHKEEVPGNLEKANQNEKYVANTFREQSYDMSPYKESDDENEEDDDDGPNDKFIPAWASKSKLASVASRQSTINPEVIFPPESFSFVNEVLLPRKCQLQ